MATQGPFDTVAQPAESEWLVQPPPESRTRERRGLSESTVIGFAAVVIFFIFAAVAVAYRQVFPDESVGPRKPTPEELDYDDQPDPEARPPERGESGL